LRIAATMPIAYLSLGSNLGDRGRNLREAIQRLETPHSRVVATSKIVESLPVGETVEPVPPYLNCAVELDTVLPPLDLLDWTQEIERAGGRTPTFRWGPRAIDIDILLYGNQVVETGRLTIPHARLRERAFALTTLADIAPELSLPDGTPIRDLLDDPSISSQVVTTWHDGSASAQ